MQRRILLWYSAEGTQPLCIGLMPIHFLALSGQLPQD